MQRASLGHLLEASLPPSYLSPTEMVVNHRSAAVLRTGQLGREGEGHRGRGDTPANL